MTQDKTYPKLCKDCKHSEPEWQNSPVLSCLHPKIVNGSPWALSHNGVGRQPHELSCHSQRNDRSWFAKCGMKGKLFEDKNVYSATLPRTDFAEQMAKKPSSEDEILRRWRENYPKHNTTYKSDQKMIEMRWLELMTDKPKLQYRTVKNYLELGLHLPIWTEWEDVLTVYEFTIGGIHGTGGGVVTISECLSASGGGGGISTTDLSQAEGGGTTWKKPEKP